MLERGEALGFLENQLELVDARRKLKEDRLGLLHDVTRAFAERIPFQNILLLARPPHQRTRPTLAEVKDDMLCLRGGICYTHSVFAYFLLRVLDFDVTLCQATVTSSVTYPNNHLDVLVRNVRENGDAYFVLSPLGYPTFQAVPLDFESESPVFTNSFLEYKYIKHEGKVMRMHGKGDFRPTTRLPFCFYIDGWRRFCETDLRTVDDVQALNSCFDDVYSNPQATPFHGRLRCSMFPEGRALIVSDAKLLRDVGEGKLETQEFQSDADLVQFLNTSFPQLGEQRVREAVRNWRHQ